MRRALSPEEQCAAGGPLAEMFARAVVQILPLEAASVRPQQAEGAALLAAAARLLLIAR